jgi:hypothetical protein
MRKYILSLIPCIMGLGCFISYEIIGSYVSSNGTLVEPFFLIPIGYFLVAIGIIAGLMFKLAPFFHKLKI